KNGDLSQKFWSTKDPGQEPFTFQIGKGQVIKGWDEGVLGMQLGEVARLRCSPDYAYGAGGFPAWAFNASVCVNLRIHDPLPDEMLSKRLKQWTISSSYKDMHSSDLSWAQCETMAYRRFL
nr:peptidyl-prolyl cis-trans isomerase FKBP12 [Tanacetum cinerariifolium]